MEQWPLIDYTLIMRNRWESFERLLNAKELWYEIKIKTCIK